MGLNAGHLLVVVRSLQHAKSPSFQCCTLALNLTEGTNVAFIAIAQSHQDFITSGLSMFRYQFGIS